MHNLIVISFDSLNSGIGRNNQIGGTGIDKVIFPLGAFPCGHIGHSITERAVHNLYIKVLTGIRVTFYTLGNSSIISLVCASSGRQEWILNNGIIQSVVIIDKRSFIRGQEAVLTAVHVDWWVLYTLSDSEIECRVFWA